MKFILTPIISSLTSILYGNKNGVEDISGTRTNFWYLLNWTSQFSVHYESHKESYANEFRRLQEQGWILEGDEIELTLSEYLSDVAKFRLVLSKAGSSDVILDDDVDKNLEKLPFSIAGMKAVFDDLRAYIRQWESATDGTATDSKVTPQWAAEWFISHGFGENSLSSITVETLKEHVNEILGAENKVDRLIGFFGTYAFKVYPNRVAQSLAWLHAFSASADAMKCLVEYLKRDSTVPAHIAAGIIDTLRQLEAPNSALVKILDSNNAGLYPLVTPLYLNIAFKDIHIPRYLEILTKLLKQFLKQMAAFETDLRSSSVVELHKTLVKHGFVVQDKVYDAQTLANQVNALIGADGPITRLRKTLHTYNGIVRAYKAACANTTKSTDGNSTSDNVSSDESENGAHLSDHNDNDFVESEKVTMDPLTGKMELIAEGPKNGEPASSNTATHASAVIPEDLSSSEVTNAPAAMPKTASSKADSREASVSKSNQEEITGSVPVTTSGKHAAPAEAANTSEGTTKPANTKEKPLQSPDAATNKDGDTPPNTGGSNNEYEEQPQAPIGSAGGEADSSKTAVDKDSTDENASKQNLEHNPKPTDTPSTKPAANENTTSSTHNTKTTKPAFRSKSGAYAASNVSLGIVSIAYVICLM